MSSNSKKALASIAKRLPRKYGRIRRNLMGKRVGYMGRSFITCDCSLRLDEIGVPISMVKNLQRPVIVRDYNFEQMMVYFMNGVDRYPGASKIKKAQTGDEHWIGGNLLDNFTLEIGDSIYIDLIDGDIVNFNRQPSLEDSSISAFTVRIMEQGDSIRMNVLSCPLFNADFDGDAMNIMAVRSAVAANEIEMTSSPAMFFVSPKNSCPKLGQMQDSIIGCAKVTRSATKLDKFHAMQCFSYTDVYADFSDISPKDIVTGRDLFTRLMKKTGIEINYKGTASFYKEQHAAYRAYDPLEVNVHIDRGTLKSGILDKSSVGAGRHGNIFHIVHNKYGPKAALELCYQFQRLSIEFLYWHGDSIHIGDFMIREEQLLNIDKVTNSLMADAMKITEDLNNGKIIPPLGKTIEEYYEQLILNALNPGDQHWEYILKGIDFENNNLYFKVSTGARGNYSNFEHIAMGVYQLDINAQRMPENFGGRASPYHPKYDADPRSRGFIPNSFMTGLTCEEEIFHAQQSRYGIIQKALSTAVTGEQNRMSIKSLESLLVDNARKMINSEKLVQPIYAGDGVDAKYLEKVKFPTVGKDMSNAKMEELYHVKNKIFGSKYAKDSKLQKRLDDEYKQLLKDRDDYRTIFTRMEKVSGKIYKDVTEMPVNVERIVSDSVYRLQLTPFVDSKGKYISNIEKSLDPNKALDKVQELLQKIDYVYLNEIQWRKRTPLPEYLINANYLLKILLRSYLNLSNLIKNGITYHALKGITQDVYLVLSSSLVSYGKAIGIEAAQCVSEPMTQMVLDSIHLDESGSTKKRGMYRIKEINGAKPTKKMKSPSMTIQLLDEYRTNEAKVREIANHIEMLSIRKFVKRWEIYIEEYGKPVHPATKHEVEMIKQFEKYNQFIKPPRDLSNWCIRMILNKEELILKQIRMGTIAMKIRDNFHYAHVVYSADNSDEIVLRIYIRNTISGKNRITKTIITNEIAKILDTIIRGIPGIIAAYVQPNRLTEVQPDGSLKMIETYQIFTDGTNLEKILENPYVDPTTVYSDSILEMVEVFGIRVAKPMIINELRHQVEGPSYRHYETYGSQMIPTGKVTSVDWHGSGRRDASILLRMSDASPLKIIKEAAVNGLTDSLKGISAPLMLMKPPFVGTLYNTFVLDEEYVKENRLNLSDIVSKL